MTMTWQEQDSKWWIEKILFIKVIALTLQSAGFTCGKCQPFAASHDGSYYHKPWSSLAMTNLLLRGPFNRHHIQNGREGGASNVESF